LSNILFFIYSYIIIPWLIIFLKVISLFNKKIKQGLEGRRETWSILEKGNLSESKVILIHCASLGEYEQIKPIINKLKTENKQHRIILSFFSPSGFNRANDELVDMIIYLPYDLPYSMKRFFRMIHAEVLILAGYDVWPNAIKWANKFSVTTIIVSARLRAGSHRLRPIFSIMHRAVYGLLDKVLTVSEGDSIRFNKLGVKESALEVLGNSRYDQVIQRKGEAVPNQDKIANILRDKIVLVLGSVWDTDISLILDPIINRIKESTKLSIIIVPHEPEDKILNLIESKFAEANIGFVRSSNIISDNDRINAIVIDEIGYLAGLYKFAHIAYMGGGFGPGIHNVMEPAVYGVPVIHGPRLNSSETVEFLDDSGGGYLVETQEQFNSIFIKLIADEEFREKSGLAAENVVIERAGATEKTVKVIQSYLT